MSAIAWTVGRYVVETLAANGIDPSPLMRCTSAENFTFVLCVCGVNISSA